MEKILILHAKAEAGKDTCAQIMKEQYEAAGKRVIVIAFADLVRFLLTKYYGITEFKTPEGRTRIQNFATEKIRGQDMTFWARHVAMFLYLVRDDFDIAIIPDWRFENEFTYIYKTFGESMVRPILVMRTNVSSVDNMTEEQRSHVSETQLDSIPESFYSAIIHNNGTIAELTETIQNLLPKI